MEEIRNAALAYYRNLSAENKQLAIDVFKAMDTNGTGKVSFRQYTEYVMGRGPVEMTYPDFFNAMDKDGDGRLDYSEFITVFYLFMDERLVFCEECTVFLFGMYFTCLQCYDGCGPAYNICSACYLNNIIDHHQGATFLDIYALNKRIKKNGQGSAGDQPSTSRASETSSKRPRHTTKVEDIREVALAYYTNLSEKEKEHAGKFFKSMDANNDGKISVKEYTDFLKRNLQANCIDIALPEFFEELDTDGNGSLDFNEAITLYYMCNSGRLEFCAECKAFLKGVYFTCVKCFCSKTSSSSYNLCCGCYSGKKFNHHEDAIYCDNFALLSKCRSIMVNAPQESKNKVLGAVITMVRVASITTAIATSPLCRIM